ncbi:MAG: 1-acyl-sn-glycerol-3-phosphate acyltransferase [Bacilli bacterium]|nr:1-acyl-sn-glycerol-3-phosphate acyltransferase [Bacilli bacterium]
MYLIILAWFNSILSTSLISIFALSYHEWYDYLWIIPIAAGCILVSHLWNFVYFAIISIFVRMKGDFAEKPNKFYRWFAEECLYFLKYFIRYRVKKEGFEKIPNEGRFVLLINHRSNFDALVNMVELRGKEVSFIAKKEISSVPIIRKYIYALGFLKLDRDDVRQNIKAIRKAQEYINKDYCSIGICPEGTRNKTKEALLPFKPGALKVATLTKVPVVMITMKNTELIGKHFPFRNTTIFMRVVETINYEDYKDMSTNELSDYCEKKMRESLIEMSELK